MFWRVTFVTHRVITTLEKKLIKFAPLKNILVKKFLIIKKD